MNRNEWIRSEIAEWRSEGVIGSDTADALLSRYAERDNKLSWGAMLAGAFGALLVGLGIIALFAANWDVFGRAARAAISISPVVLCGAIAIVASWKGWKSMGLWEPLGILWFISTGAATCLVAQTYQVGGSVPGLVLFVTFLTLPVVWVTKSVAAMAGWPILAIVWGLMMQEDHGASYPLLFKSVALLAVSLPAFVAFIRRKPGRGAMVTGQLAIALVYSCGLAGLISSQVDALFRIFSGEPFICIFWVCSAIVILAGIFFKLSAWPIVATLVAACAATPTAFCDPWIYIAALLLAAGIVAFGVWKIKLSFTNIGAALLLWLIISKFFESEISFTAKGIILILSGVALAALNVVMVKAKKRRTAK